MTEYELTKSLIRKGALEACAIADSLVDNDPPIIVVRAEGLTRAPGRVALLQFTAEGCNEIDVASNSVAEKLRSYAVRRALLRVPAGARRVL